MRTAFVNLPSAKKLVRRFTCSYHAPNFLFPPLELLSLAAVAREWKNVPVRVIDAVAERLSCQRFYDQLRRFDPDVLVFLTGIETFGVDMEQISKVRGDFPSAKIILTGYLPTCFPGPVLEQCPDVDFILLNEPEFSFAELFDCLVRGDGPSGIEGVAWREDGMARVNPPRERIRDLDCLPVPARDLIDNSLYHEFLAPRPFTTIQSSRGCPARCTYCVRTFGRKLGFRSVDHLLREIRAAVTEEGVRAIRFTDDNFCADGKRVGELCRRVIAEGLNFQWSCLSRVDTLDKELLDVMARAGCSRVYLGIETFSQRLLDLYDKRCDAGKVRPLIAAMKARRIESVGFFMVGGRQTRKELESDMAQAKECGLDYIVVEKLTPYPGTPLFGEMKDEIEFSLFPYVNRLRDREREREIFRWEREFYRDFYLRPSFAGRMLKRLAVYPGDLWRGAKDLWRYAGEAVDPELERGDLI